MRFRFPNIDTFSFWLGFILASLSWWVFSMLRPAFQHLRATARVKQAEKKEILHTTSGVEERLASLSYLRMIPVEGVFGALYQSMYGGESTLREAVFQTFAEMAARGVDVPDPAQFGVGF